MADVKEYAYYIEGNKVAIVERDTAFDNNVDSKEYGPGVSRSYWKSPLSSVTDGLEIKYAHTHEYWLSSSRSIGYEVGANFDETYTSIYCSAYGEKGGYFSLFFPNVNSSLSGGNLDMTTLTAGNYIVVHNHPQFNGIHKIKSVIAGGIIQTETKWNSGLGKAERDDTSSFAVTYEADDDSITMASAPAAFNGISVGDYIFIPAATTVTTNEGLFKVSSVSTGGSDGVLKVDTQYYLDRTSSTPGTLGSLASNIGDETETIGGWTVRQALLSEGAYVDIIGVNVMQDESDDIDLPSYLQKALVYYVKARVAEDMGEIELKEYNMREYKKHIETYESTLIKGPRMISSGHHAIR